MFMTVTVVQTASQFCFWSFDSFLSGWVLSFPCFVIGGCLMSDLKYLQSHYLVISQCFSGWNSQVKILFLWRRVRLALLFILLSGFFFLVSWSFVLCFFFPSLEYSVAGWRNVNLALPFLNCENGDLSILIRDISFILEATHCLDLWVGVYA